MPRLRAAAPPSPLLPLGRPDAAITTSAAGTLWYLSATEWGVRAILHANGVEPLLTLQKLGGDSSAANYAASALENLVPHAAY